MRTGIISGIVAASIIGLTSFVVTATYMNPDVAPDTEETKTTSVEVVQPDDEIVEAIGPSVAETGVTEMEPLQPDTVDPDTVDLDEAKSLPAEADTDIEVPQSYFQCTAIDPENLVHAYTDHETNVYITAPLKEVVFLFSGQTWKQSQIDSLYTDGYIWVDLVKCYVVNADSCSQITPGEEVDIIGINTGETISVIDGLIFTDCYVVPAGSVQFEAESMYIDL